MGAATPLAAVLAAIALTAAPGRAVAAPSLEPVDLETVPVPEHVHDPQFPQYTADGGHLTFGFTSSSELPGAHLALITPRGEDFRCLTCPLGPDTDIGKPFPFEDGRRVLVRTPSGSAEGQETAAFTYAIVECEPGILDCETVRLVPIEVPGEATRAACSRRGSCGSRRTVSTSASRRCGSTAG